MKVILIGFSCMPYLYKPMISKFNSILSSSLHSLLLKALLNTFILLHPSIHSSFSAYRKNLKSSEIILILYLLEEGDNKI